jgi:hypothetical protein
MQNPSTTPRGIGMREFWYYFKKNGKETVKVIGFISCFIGGVAAFGFGLTFIFDILLINIGEKGAIGIVVLVCIFSVICILSGVDLLDARHLRETRKRPMANAVDNSKKG